MRWLIQYLGEGCLCILEGNFTVVLDSRWDADSLSGDITPSIQRHSTHDGAGVHTTHSQLVFNLAPEGLLRHNQTYINTLTKVEWIKLNNLISRAKCYQVLSYSTCSIVIKLNVKKNVHQLIVKNSFKAKSTLARIIYQSINHIIMNVVIYIIWNEMK